MHYLGSDEKRGKKFLAIRTKEIEGLPKSLGHVHGTNSRTSVAASTMSSYEISLRRRSEDLSYQGMRNFAVIGRAKSITTFQWREAGLIMSLSGRH